jgi:hypothetical protein
MGSRDGRGGREWYWGPISKFIQHNAFSMDNQRPADIPSELHHLIHLNVAYRVLICPHNECRKAVQPGAFREHLRKHQTPLRDRERVQEYINGFSWDYDFSTIQLPKEGSRPQPIIPVVDGFQCQTCPFKSSNRKSIKVHGNREHEQQRVGDDELFKKVRLQSWFQDHRQRYWVVDESERGDGREDVGIGEEEDRITGLGLREDEGVVDASIDVEDDKVEEIGEVETRDEEVAEAVVNKVVEVVVDEGVEAVVDDEEEVFSAFDDSGDEDYKESSEDGVEDGEGGSSEVEVNRSDDEEYEESSGAANDDKEEGLSEVDVDQSGDGVQSSGVPDDDEEEVITIRSVESRDNNPSRKWKARKRKLQSEFEDSGVVDIDSEDDIYRNSSPAFRERRRRVTKWQKRMPRFDDSGVVMGSSQDDGVVRSSSQDDGVVPPSSPPVLEGMIGNRLGGVDDTLRFPEPPNTVVRAVHDDEGDDGNDVPFQPKVGTVQWRLDKLRKRLEKWCRTCPACYLAGDFGGEVHHMRDCWRHDMVEIMEQTVVMQQHVEKFGGFQGRGGCLWCGVPRAICQRWQVKADGDWEEVPGQQCQYMEMLVPAVVTMLMDGCNEGWEVMRSWMDRDGVMQTKQAEVFEWFRQERWWDDMEVEVARIVRVFYMLVNKNRGVGRT